MIPFSFLPELIHGNHLLINAVEEFSCIPFINNSKNANNVKILSVHMKMLLISWKEHWLKSLLSLMLFLPMEQALLKKETKILLILPINLKFQWLDSLEHGISMLGISFLFKHSSINMEKPTFKSMTSWKMINSKLLFWKLVLWSQDKSQGIWKIFPKFTEDVIWNHWNGDDKDRLFIDIICWFEFLKNKS